MKMKTSIQKGKTMTTRTFDQKIVHQKMQDGYSHYNYAILHCRGLNHVFDMMRYDTAFFARRSDVANIIEKLKKYGDVLTSRFSILLCKYDWHGVTKPNWTPARLCGDQEYEFINDVSALYELNSEMTTLRPNKKLKIASELEYTGTVSEILQVMLDNHAFPANEGAAHQIEREFYVEDQKPITVQLKNYQLAETAWLIKTPA